MSSLGLKVLHAQSLDKCCQLFLSPCLSVTTAPSRRQYFYSGDTSDSWCATAQRATCFGAPLESPVAGAVHVHGQQRLHMLVQMPLMLQRRSRVPAPVRQSGVCSRRLSNVWSRRVESSRPHCKPNSLTLPVATGCVICYLCGLFGAMTLVLLGHGNGDWASCRGFVNCVLASLNCLYHLPPSAHAPASRTKGQQAALVRILDRVCDFAGRIKTALDAGGVSLPAWASDGLLGNIVPVPPVRCHRLSLRRGACHRVQPTDTRVRQYESSQSLSSNGPKGWVWVCSVGSQATGEREAGFDSASKRRRAGFHSAKAWQKFVSGSVAWATSLAGLTKTAQVTPPCLATALTYLMALPGRPVRMSKRDAKCWFDQLRAPRQLRPWFARPPVSIDMLLSSGLVSEDLVRRALNAGRDGKLPRRAWPVSVVWPMGYSWSSFVAQEALLSVASSSGLDTKNILSADTPVPAFLENTFALATDDALFFSTSDGGSGRMASNDAGASEMRTRASPIPFAARVWGLNWKTAFFWVCHQNVVSMLCRESSICVGVVMPLPKRFTPSWAYHSGTTSCAAPN